MKFHNIQSWQNHLKGDLQNFSSGYWIALSSDFERRLQIQRLIEVLRKAYPEAFVQWTEGFKISDLLAELNTKSLFCGSKIVVCNDAEKFKKQDLESLSLYFSKPAPDSFLLLGSSHFKNFEAFYQKTKKEVVVLDLSEEKPWDKQKRMLQALHDQAEKSGKRLSLDAASLLLHQNGTEAAFLQSELEKLITYVGERMDIAKEDVQILGSSSFFNTTWQIAEQLVWGEGIASLPKLTDSSWFLGLIGQLRYQLQIGLQMSLLLEQRRPMSEIQQLFPTLKENVIEKYCQKAFNFTSEYFRHGLLLLFDVERTIKVSFIDPMLLWEMFAAKLIILKEINEKAYFVALTQSS